MKVLMISTSSIEYNGIGRYVVNFVNNYNKNQISLDVLAPNRVKDEIRKSIDGKCTLLQVSNTNDKLKQKRPLNYFWYLVKLIKSNKYDIVHVHGSSSMMCVELIAAKLAGCKIRIAHSHNTMSSYKKLDIILRWVFHKSYTDALACGEEAGIWLFDANQFTVINNGQDIDKFSFHPAVREKLRKENGLEHCIVLGHIGGFNNQKNHSYLIDIFYDTIKDDIESNYRLVLVGDGENRTEIEEKAKYLKIEDKIIFLGAIDNVNEWIQAMDIMLLPSLYEGFPISLIECQIACLPCYVSDRVTKKVRITDLVKFFSVDGATSCWVKAIKETQLGNRNDKRVIEEIIKQGFDLQSSIKKLENYYDNCMKSIQS